MAEPRPAAPSEWRTPHSLPLQPTPFIGRDQELADIRRLLDEPACRLLTVLGPGGIGKTRLAIAAAEAVQDAFPDGVVFVPLAPLASSEPIVSAVAESVGFRLSESGDAQRQLIDYLRGRHMLLLLDNFEHVLAGAGLVVAILQAAPDMKLLVTSRERLNLSGEMVYPLGGMAVPERGVDRSALEYGAAQLLMQQARLARPNLDVRADDLDAITRICWLVQGTPLALVLAAGWLEVLSFAEIADEIARSLDILDSQLHDLPERQRSVRAAFDYSWNRLSAEEQLAFVKLSVFQGGFTRQGAQAVAGADTRMLRTLAHKSFLALGEDNRYEFHELLRQYATERLKADPAVWTQTRHQHGAYYVGFLHDQGKLMQGSGQKAAFQAVAAEFDNISAAWNWLLEQQRFEAVIHDMLPALFRYCEVRARLPDLMSLLEATRQALTAEPNSADEALTAPLLTAQAAFLSSGYSARLDYYGYLTNANRATIAQAWAAATPETVRAMGFLGTILAYLYSRIVDREQGTSPLRQLVGYFDQENQRWERAFTLQHLALLQLWKPQGQTHNQTEQFLAEALAIFRELGDERESGCTLRWLGQFHRINREPLMAIRQWQAAQSILQEAGEWELAADINSQLGDVYLQLGELDQAFRCYRAMSQAYLERGHKRLAITRLSKEGYESLRYRDIDQARQIRLHCLALCREVGDVFQEAWSCWEMGEVERVAGDFTAARQWYEQAKKLFERHDDGGSATFYYRGLADIACATGDYTEAQRLFEVSLKHARAADHSWAQSYALSGLGRAALGLGQYETARRQFAEALRRAVVLGENGMALVALAGIAGLCAATGEDQRAIELSALVASHYGSWRETRVQAAACAATAAAALSPDDCAAAQARGQRLELWETASDLLETLAQPNPE